MHLLAKQAGDRAGRGGIATVVIQASSTLVHSKNRSVMRAPVLQRSAGMLVPAVLSAAAFASAGSAQAQLLNGTGVVGGLSIPDARPLGSGTLAFGLGNPREPQVVATSSRSVSYVLGVGLAPGLDLVGRLAEYSTRQPDGLLIGGISDLSVNLKFSASLGSGGDAPRVALGLQDVAGGAVNFRAGYAVATQPWGPWSFTLGAGASRARQLPGTRASLDGAFGGIGYRMGAGALPGTLTLAAEHDGRQALAGARWLSPAVPALGGSRLSASVHRTAERGAMPGSTALGFFLTLPLGEESADRPVAAEPSAQRAAPLPEAAADSGPARLGRLQEALVTLGLERVRVGRLGAAWVVRYENQRFGHHEFDALGLVLGLASEAAPPGVERIVAVALKTGQPVLTVSVGAQAWRDFLGDGRAGPAREAMQIWRGAQVDEAAVDWLADREGPATLAHVRLTPELNYAVATEYGALHHALAGRASVAAPLWTGARLVIDVQRRLTVSAQATETGVFASLRPPNGLRALALHQSLWLGQYAVLGATAGIFEHRAPGVEGEALVFVPGRDDVLRLRGRRVELQPEMPPGSDLQQWVSYRWVPSFAGWARDTWVEFGAQRYADRGSGPLLTVSRWWGDFGVHLTYREGGARRFAGMELSFPLTPRVAPRTGPVQFSGPSQWRQGLRTRLTDSQTAQNWVEPQALRDLTLALDIEARNLDAGRLGFVYTVNQLHRMRDAYDQVPTNSP
jgi:hypothetical protein